MCTRHSFLMDKEGRIYDGRGLTHSHTEIAVLHDFPSELHDDLNAYEWQPPEGWDGSRSMVWGGLRVDRQNFEAKSSHDKAIERYIVKRFPDMAAWDAPESADDDLHGQTVALGGESVTVYCHGTYRVTEGRHFAFDSASVEASGYASVRASGYASVRASGYASVRAFDSASVRAFDSASVEASDSASVEASGYASVEASGYASVEAFGHASVRAFDSASVRASGYASVRALDSASVRAFGYASVEAFDSASVRALDSASVEAFDSASVCLSESWSAGVGVSLSGNAVVIDRMGGGITIFCAGPVEVCGW